MSAGFAVVLHGGVEGPGVHDSGARGIPLERIGVSKRLAGLGIQAPQFSIRDGDRELVPVRFDRPPTEYPYTLQNITEQGCSTASRNSAAVSTARTSPPG